MKIRFIQCEHECGGKPIKFATPGVKGFKCSNCGAEVITDWGTNPSASNAQPENKEKVKRRYF
jgi:DNA-directed RNA polymerase subunit RPC12/RpoP